MTSEAGAEAAPEDLGSPVAPRGGQWRRWPEVADLFDGPADPTWATDRDLVDGTLHDPWADDGRPRTVDRER